MYNHISTVVGLYSNNNNYNNTIMVHKMAAFTIKQTNLQQDYLSKSILGVTEKDACSGFSLSF